MGADFGLDGGAFRPLCATDLSGFSEAETLGSSLVTGSSIGESSSSRAVLASTDKGTGVCQLGRADPSFPFGLLSSSAAALRVANAAALAASLAAALAAAFALARISAGTSAMISSSSELSLSLDSDLASMDFFSASLVSPLLDRLGWWAILRAFMVLEKSVDKAGLVCTGVVDFG